MSSAFWTRGNCRRPIFVSLRQISYGRCLMSCRKKSRVLEFSLPAAAPKKIDNRSRAFALKFGHRQKLWLEAIAIPVWPQRLVIAMELLLTPEAVRPSPVAETSESRTQVDGDTFWAMPAALIFSACKPCA